MPSAAKLDDFEPFRNLSENSRGLLEQGLRHASFADTATVLSKGQRISGAYVVLSGQLRVFTLTPNGKEATLYWINPGETCVLALNCIFNDLLYPAWVEARPATVVAVIPGTLYRALFEAEPAIQNMTVQAFSTIVFRLMAELEDIHAHKLEQRLANFLLLRASVDARVRMTQREIASHLGTSREVIARVLSQLVADQYIETSRNLIVIHDPRRLARLAGKG
ncbi:MAG TPA: Crp/Fnr family transcriptional regulator [Gammaproteobacteria bacterium]|nr:Crp/Fnr family transcriptional regulator [Gammaproteobacteria bacterium]